MTEDFMTAGPLGPFAWRRTPALLVALVAGAGTACAEADQQAAEMPPVEATASSQDERILAAPGTMSDGSPVAPHTTETVATGIELVSDGLIGGMSIDADGNVYNTNFRNTIWRTAPDGTTTVLNDEFTAASGNFALANGDLMQGEWRENRIYRIDPDGTRSVFAEGGLDGPVGIVQRPQGDFIVANSRGAFLARVPAEGGEAEVALRHGKMTQPNGVTIDPDGNIYVADLDGGIVFKWTPDGDVIELAELPGGGNAHNVYAGGALYVNKIWDHVIYRVDLETGAYGIVTGTGHPGYEDGPTGTATIEEPNGIATNAAKDVVYFNTHRGKMFEAPGRVIVRRLVLPAS
ncbi:MAG: SMP-30/gluconolactonase/LRE family protein [Gemmatimonadota bacterium]